MTSLAVQRLTFHDGNTMPQLGLGVYKIGDDEASSVVRAAIETGYRLIDTASMYLNEEGVGQGIKQSGIARSDLFVTTKFWLDDLGFERTKTALRRSLDKLQLDYVDCYMIHWPAPQRGLYTESWAAMEDLRDEGLVRSIGVSNFHPYHLEKIFLMARYKPVINQIEIHPWLVQDNPIAFNHSHNIRTQAWSPLARGQLLAEPTLFGLAGKYGKSVAQLVIRWHIQRGYGVIPKSTQAERIASNAEVFDFEIESEDMAAITTLNKDYRTGVDPDDRN